MKQQIINMGGGILLGIVGIVFVASGDDVTMGWVFIAAGVILFFMNLYAYYIQRKELNKPLVNNDEVRGFYERTQEAWVSGKYNDMGAGLDKLGAKKYNAFVIHFFPNDKTILHAFFSKFKIQPDEHLIFRMDNASLPIPAQYMMTNKRLIHLDGKTNEYSEIPLGEIAGYDWEEANGKASVHVKLQSGETKTFEEIALPFDKEEFMRVLEMARN